MSTKEGIWNQQQGDSHHVRNIAALLHSPHSHRAITSR